MEQKPNQIHTALFSEDSSDDGKRKRNSPEEFQRSKRTVRTPIKNKLNVNMAEELKETMKQIMKEMSDNMAEQLKEMTKEIRGIREEQQEYRRDIQALKEENQKLNKTVTILENKIEYMEKKEKKCNVIIKGLHVKENDVNEKVNTMLQEKLDIGIKVKTIMIIPNNKGPIIVAQTESWKDKEAIMKSKNKLNGTNIYIENDLTVEERVIQTTLRKMAKDEREKGNKVVVKYNKIIINNKTWVWDKKLKNLAPKTINEDEWRRNKANGKLEKNETKN